MKKIAILLAAAGAVFGLASCSQDRDPVLQMPTSYTLNVPAMQDQYIDLTAGQTIQLVSSQPDYGMALIANYSAQMSLTEDFAQAYDLTPVKKTLAKMDIKQEDVALGVMELSGVTDEATFAQVYPDGLDYMKIYFRAVSEVPDVEGTKIVSNVVYYNYLKPYFAVPVPGYIYLVGKPEGWAGPTESNAAHYESWKLFEPKDAIGSKVYSGVFDIPAGSAMFRFYTALTGWDADSYGSQEADAAIDFPDFTSGTFTSPIVKGKGSFNFPNWPGGKMTITVDMSDMKNITMTCTAGEVSVTVTKYIYMMGSAQGWDEPSTANADLFKDWRLADSTGSGIYTGEFTIPAGDWYVRFCMELNDDGWDNATQFGAAEGESNVDAAFSNNKFSSAYVMGKGNWAFAGFAGGQVSVTVDTNNNTVEFVAL